VILLDTHALLWWALDPEQLSTPALQALAALDRQGGYASSISIWEIGVKIKNRKLDIGIGVDELARRLERSGAVELVPVDTTVWLRSLALDWSHRDPADRVIVATALLKGVPLLTKDEAIRSFHGIETIW
jgi:PIN domain nuclease of toxin-antitoxin system